MTVPTNEQIEAMIARLEEFSRGRQEIGINDYAEDLADEAADMLAALNTKCSKFEALAMEGTGAILRLQDEIARLEAAQATYRGAVAKSVRSMLMFANDREIGEWMDSVVALAEQTKGDDAK